MCLFAWTQPRLKSSNTLGNTRGEFADGTPASDNPIDRRRVLCVRYSATRSSPCIRGCTGTRCSTAWNDNVGVPISSITFRVLPDYSGALAIHFDHQLPATSCMPARIQRQIVPITTTKGNFGGVRRWFRCSIIKGGYPCKRRVRTLYSTPREKMFGCRQERLPKPLCSGDACA